MDIRLKLSEDPSKIDEIQLLYKLCNSLPRVSYLGMIFKKLTEFVPQMIKNDFAYPLEDPTTYVDQRDKIKELESRVESCMEAITVKNERIHKLESENETLEARTNAINRRYENILPIVQLYNKHKKLIDYMEDIVNGL